MPAKIINEACVECHEVESEHTIRNRRLCSACFIRYITSKVLKRMESYRFKNLKGNRRPKLLLPVSGGVSSMVLLQVLDGQLQKQRSIHSRTAYELMITHVDMSLIDSGPCPSWYSWLEEKYSSHEFLSVVPLGSVAGLDPDFEFDMQQLGFPRQAGESSSDFLERIITVCRTHTSRADMLSTLMQRILVNCAKAHECEAVLWGHSDSRLAAKALAAVAKGRGASLVADIMDGPSGALGLKFMYPLRDLFKPELELYATLQPEGFSDFCTDPASTEERIDIRNTSIDDLLSTYITSQGEKYPGIMANVVRTIGKLQPPGNSKGTFCCVMCKASLPQNEDLHLIGQLCYACKRTRKEMVTEPTKR